MLWEGDHPYEYMDGWDTFSETSLSEKKKRISQQPDKEFITKDYYKHAKRVCEDFGSQNLG